MQTRAFAAPEVLAVIGIGGFCAALRVQLRADTHHPVRYWLTVLSVALLGTMIADGPHVVLGAPSRMDSIVHVVLLSRPLGASVADWLAKGSHQGGMGWAQLP